MRLLGYILSFVILILLYLFMTPLFILGLSLLIIHIVYKIYKKMLWYHTPRGKRIKHGLLKGYYMERYGRKGGKDAYRETVKELRKEGYR